MPAAWIGAIAAGASAINSMSNSGGGGGGSSGPTNVYNAENEGAANMGWLTGFNQLGSLAQQGYTSAMPGFNQSLQNANNINFNPYLQSASMEGQQYAGLADVAGRQMNQYGAAASQAANQQQSLYGAGNQIFQTAFDPQSALYNQTANNLTNQVNAGQALRGLGNSPVGGAEYNQAMQNFNMDWQNQQLQRQTQGAQAMGQLNRAGLEQGQMYGADLSAQLGAGQNMAGFTGQSGSIPLGAQQAAAAFPGQAASTYTSQLGALGSLYGNVTGQALPYLAGGQGAQQYNTGYNTAQNSANMNLLMNSLSPNNPANQNGNGPGSWLQNMFGGNNMQSYGNTPSGSASLNSSDQSAIWAANDYGGGV